MSLIAAVVLTVYMLAAPEPPHTCPATPSPDTIANISQFS